MPAIAHQNKILGDDIQSIHWSQAKTSVKKNLLPITLAELKSLNTTGTWNNNIYTLNGLTYTITTDRGYVSQISVSGTASAETHLQLGAWMKLGDLSYRFNGVSNATTGIMWISSVSGTYTLTSSVSEVSFTSHTSDDWAIYITYGNGTTPSGEVFKPMLRDASISDSTYVPYIKDNVELDADKADKTQITNPNLLDNPWFTINQRGASSYDGSTFSAGYSVDRWRVSNNTSAISVTDDGIVIDTTESNAYQYFQQRIENGRKQLGGKTVTLSILMKDGTIYTATGICPSEVPASSSTNFGSLIDDVGHNFTATSLYLNTGDQLYVQIGCNKNARLEIKAIKLEIGSISTLALDTAPNYASELLKCQRYFVRQTLVNTGALGIAIAQNINYAIISIPVMNMRVLPSIIMNGALLAGTITIESVQVYSKIASAIMLRLNATGLLTANTSYSITASQATTIDLSADL